MRVYFMTVKNYKSVIYINISPNINYLFFALRRTRPTLTPLLLVTSEPVTEDTFKISTEINFKIYRKY